MYKQLRNFIALFSRERGERLAVSFCPSELTFCTAAAGNLQKPFESTSGIGTASRQYGQPTSETHPHLLKTGEVTPGIQMDEYVQRRRRLMRAIDQYAEHASLRASRHLVIVPSAVKTYMSENIPYPFRQNSDFFYLSGFLEPESCLVLLSDEAVWSTSVSDSCRSVMFVQPKDAHGELWDGPRTGSDGAVKLLGVDESHHMSELPRFLSSYLAGCNSRTSSSSVALWYDAQNSVQPHVDALLKRAVLDNSPKFVNSPRSLIQQLRVFKSDAEARLMAIGCDIASKAMAKAMEVTVADGRCTEHLLSARIDYECRSMGAERLAYPPVVAGGPRATVIHYVANTQRLSSDELVLVDAGCDYHGYASDLSRTWPVADHFLEPHRELYEALLDVQTSIIRRCASPVNRPSLDQLFNYMIDLLGDRLRDVGVINRNADKADRNRAAHQYCPHHAGHFLGLDVHDTPLVPRSRPLQPGMVITVEPGVYIRADDRRVPAEFRGLGIRIEDNLLMKADSTVVLSRDCPKTISEILQLRQKTDERTQI